MGCPTALAARPHTVDGLPITYVTAVIDGRPDFTTLDDDRFVEVLERGWCGLCGTPLGYWMAAIGSPREMRKRLFRDPPMHVDCAEYAMEVCPFIAKRMNYRPVSAKPAAGPGSVRVSVPSARQRPDELVLGEFRSYRWGIHDGRPFVRTSPMKRTKARR
jgi:hypothetical protein